MKSKNKLEGASSLRAWKTRIDLILPKNKVLDIVKGNIMEPPNDAEKEKEPKNKAGKEKFRENDINAMSIIVNSIRDHLITYISNLDTSNKMYDYLTKLFIVKHEDIYLFYFSPLVGFIEDNDDTWLIDSGASIHMTCDRVNLSSVREKMISHRVELGDNNLHAVKGMFYLISVLYVPGLKKNLVSISF
jgi:hypothetical protein